MTVAELIETLKALPQDMQVVTFGGTDNSARPPEPRVTKVGTFPAQRGYDDGLPDGRLLGFEAKGDRPNGIDVVGL